VISLLEVFAVLHILLFEKLCFPYFAACLDHSWASSVEKIYAKISMFGVIRGAGVATEYGLDGRDLISKGEGNFLYSTASRPALGSTQPPIQWLPGLISLA
jgi:hypothetical protein